MLRYRAGPELGERGPAHVINYRAASDEKPLHAQLVASASILFRNPVETDLRAIPGDPVFLPDMGPSLRLSTIERSKISVQN
jgi:hypothetical protein